MKITEISEPRDSYDSIIYDSLIFTRLKEIETGLLTGADLEILCESYKSLKKKVIGISIDEELTNKFKEIEQLLLANNGSTYLTEELS